jgi:hypothetical protein
LAPPLFDAPPLAVLLAPPFAPLLDDVPVDLAALFFAVDGALFLAPDFAADFLLVVPLFFAAVDAEPFVPPLLVSFVGFDLSSVGIAASFKDLHVQPSRLHKATSLYQASSGFRKV